MRLTCSKRYGVSVYNSINQIKIDINMKTMKWMGMALAAVMIGLSTTSCQRMVHAILDKALKEVMNHDYQDSEKWGKVVTRDLDLKDFQQININGAVRVEFTQDSLYSVQAYGNEKAIDAYSVKVSGGLLFVSYPEKNGKINKNTPSITLRIAAPLCKKVEVSGACEFVQQGVVEQSESLTIEVNGAGDIDLSQMTVGDLKISVSGAGDVDLQDVKSTGDVDVSIVGAGDTKGSVEAKNISLTVKGAGDGKMQVCCNRLLVNCAGAGDIALTGSCKELLKSGDNIKVEGLKIENE